MILLSHSLSRLKDLVQKFQSQMLIDNIGPLFPSPFPVPLSSTLLFILIRAGRSGMIFFPSRLVWVNKSIPVSTAHTNHKADYRLGPVISRVCTFRSPSPSASTLSEVLPGHSGLFLFLAFCFFLLLTGNNNFHFRGRMLKFGKMILLTSKGQCYKREG